MNRPAAGRLPFPVLLALAVSLPSALAALEMPAASASESIVEVYSSVGFGDLHSLSLDYNLVHNPAYNHDHCPVNILAVRGHFDLRAGFAVPLRQTPAGRCAAPPCFGGGERSASEWRTGQVLQRTGLPT